MTGAPSRALLFALGLFGISATASCERSPAPPPARTQAGKPTLLLLTSLPLVFGEQFSLDGGGSPALKALEARYRVRPISVSSKAELGTAKLLLMAHPPAQASEDLVALDQWVRGGGRVLLLADPLLEWPSARPLGDRLRPSAMFADTGLLSRWNLRLDAPDERGPKMRRLGGHDVMAASPGSLSGGCTIASDGFVAQCRIGKGRATVVADADVLGVEHLDGPTDRNLDGLLAELAALER
jgi:hypothetical protein